LGYDEGERVVFLNITLIWFIIPVALLYYYHKKTLIETTHIVILLLLLLALMRPVWQQEPKETQIEARDIIIALDISYSMRAKDITPSRYEYAKETIELLLKQNSTDNITLIAFTTNPLLLSPPTTDHTLISIALSSLNIEYILTHGTSIKRLLEMVAELNIVDKNLILITDGGEESGSTTLNQMIKSSHISLTTLAVGTTRGTTILTDDGSLLKDDRGDLIISRLNPMLKSLNSGYIEANSPSKDAKKILKSIANQTTKSVTKMQLNYIELYSIPLLLALLLFITIHTRAIKYLIIVLALFGVEATASVLDSLKLLSAYSAYSEGDFNTSQRELLSITDISLESQMALGGSYYRGGLYQKALDIYLSISSTSKETKRVLYYNIANCYIKLDRYTEAIESYIKSLQLGFDEDSINNLAIAIEYQKGRSSNIAMSSPHSQNSSANSSKEGKSSNKKENSQDSSGSSGGSQKGKKSKKEEAKSTLLESTPPSPRHPISSKVYDLINRGYIYEKQPW
jgi:Ca-activated chloride channel family protein